MSTVSDRLLNKLLWSQSLSAVAVVIACCSVLWLWRDVRTLNRDMQTIKQTRQLFSETFREALQAGPDRTRSAVKSVE